MFGDFWLYMAFNNLDIGSNFNIGSYVDRKQLLNV